MLTAKQAPRRPRTNQALLSLLLSVCWLSAACAQVLGFQDATLDPLSLEASQPDAGSVGEMPISSAALDTDVDEPELTCETFCGVVQAACGNDGPFAVYDSEFTCIRQCRAFDVGNIDDDVGNTLGCRYTNARVALMFPGERAVSCFAAGPGGNGVCGANCQGYCTLMLDTCGFYSNRDECLLACSRLEDTGGFSINDIEGPTLQCRMYHLGAALVSPSLHCKHAAGAYPCSSEKK